MPLSLACVSATTPAAALAQGLISLFIAIERAEAVASRVHDAAKAAAER